MRPSSSSAAMAIARISFSDKSLNFFSIVASLVLPVESGLWPRPPCSSGFMRKKNRIRTHGSHLNELSVHLAPGLPAQSGFDPALLDCGVLVVRAWRRANQTPLQRGVENLHEDVTGEEAFAPGVLEVGKRLRGDSFLRGLACGLQLADALPRRTQHVAELHEIGLGAQCPVAGNDLRGIIR